MSRFFAVMLAAFLLAAQPKSQAYTMAAQKWATLDKYDRARVQVHLATAGYWASVPNQDFSQRLFEAITKFQFENGLPVTGYMVDRDWDALLAIAKPILAHWGLKEVKHPSRNVSIWVPLGMGLQRERMREGYEYTDPQSRIMLHYKYFPNSSLENDYRALMQQFTRENYVIHYQVLRKDFFVISAFKDGVTRYLRYHRDGNGLLGFTFAWRDAGPPVWGERLVTVISGSLWAVANGVDYIYPPNYEPEVAAAPPSPSKPAAVTAKPEEPKEKGLSSGTGFFVTNDGYIVTNHHVIEQCTDVAVTSDQHEPTIVRVVGSDATNDLALLKTTLRSPVTANLRVGVRLGEPVAVFGYPLASMLASSGNFTLGSITALAGLKDDTRHLQIQAPVQPGNSGGPLLDDKGNLIGVVDAKLNALNVASATGDIPQNVNFAIKAGVLSSFLDSKGIVYDTTPRPSVLPSADLADRAKAMSVMVVCK
jgi:S1-C subfamily serine protease